MGEVPTVEQARPLLALGMVTVPVMPLGTGLTAGDAVSGKPFGPTDAPGTIPNEEVVPIGGVSVSTWANAGLQHNKGNVAATIDNGFMEDFPDKSGRIALRAAASAAVSRTAGVITLFFMIADTG